MTFSKTTKNVTIQQKKEKQNIQVITNRNYIFTPNLKGPFAQSQRSSATKNLGWPHDSSPPRDKKKMISCFRVESFDEG